MASKPMTAIIRCVLATEMYAMYQELSLGGTDESEELWDAAELVREFIDVPRVKDHRAKLLAQIEQMREARQAQRGRLS